MFLRGVFWDSIGRVLIHSIGIVYTAFLARILTPGDYGLVAIAIALIVIGEALIEGGFASALIQKKRITRADYCTVFYFQICLACIVFLGLLSLSEPMSRMFGYPELKQIISVLAFSIPLAGLVSVIRARLLRSVNFRQVATIDVIATIIGGGCALVLAVKGFGYWALVVQVLAIKFVCVCLFWAKFPLKLSIGITAKNLGQLANFGVFSSFTTIFRNVTSQFDSFIIAKLFMPDILGLYTKAKSIRDLIVVYAGGSVGRVFFPVVSRLKSGRLADTYFSTLEVVAIVSLLLSGIVFVSVEELVLLLFGNQWLESVLMIQFLVVADGVTKPMGSVMLSTLAGIGAVRLEFVMVLVKRSVWVFCILILWVYGIDAYLWSLVVHAMFVYVIDAISIFYSTKFNLKRQLMLPLFGYLFFALSVFLVGLIEMPFFNTFLSLLIKSTLFVLLFLMFSFPFYKNLYLSFLEKIGGLTLGK